MNRKPRLDHFARAALLAAVGRSNWLIGVFVVGVILLDVVANLTYDLFVQGELLTTSLYIRSGVLIAALLGIAGVFYLLDLRQVQSRSTEIVLEAIEPHRGLVWLLSPGNPEPLLRVMEHHVTPQGASQDRLGHCWVILSDHPAVTATYEDLPDEMERWGISDVILHPVYIDQPGIKTTYHAVTHIYEDHVPDVGLSADEVVTDLTGGLKTMTAGALIACLPPKGTPRPVEYLLSKRDPVTGEPIAGSECPMKLDVRFYAAQISG